MGEHEVMRQQFEEWAEDKDISLDERFFADGNNYESEKTKLAFESFCAGYAASSS